MKIYFDTNCVGDSTSPCPYGKDCMVGSFFCQQCEHCMYTKRWHDADASIFYVGNKASMRPSEYVECSCSGDVTLWKLIKKFFYKH